MYLTLFPYLAPVIPVFGHAAMVFRFRPQMVKGMTEKTAARDAHRTFIMTLTGFSFTGLLAIAVVDTTIQQSLHLSVFYLLVSFLCYLFALNLQAYKALWWHDQLGDFLIEAATLSLLLSVVAIVWISKQPGSFKYLVTILAVTVWFLDHIIRIRILWQYLKEMEAANVKQKG